MSLPWNQRTKPSRYWRIRSMRRAWEPRSVRQIGRGDGPEDPRRRHERQRSGRPRLAGEAVEVGLLDGPFLVGVGDPDGLGDHGRPAEILEVRPRARRRSPRSRRRPTSTTSNSIRPGMPAALNARSDLLVTRLVDVLQDAVEIVAGGDAGEALREIGRDDGDDEDQEDPEKEAHDQARDGAPGPGRDEDPDEHEDGEINEAQREEQGDPAPLAARKRRRRGRGGRGRRSAANEKTRIGRRVAKMPRSLPARAVDRLSELAIWSFSVPSSFSRVKAS